MVAQTADVIIIGGGIAGCSAAYFLSRQGRSVLLIEKDAVAAHASGFAFGVLLPRLYDDPSDPADDLTRLSLELHERVASELAETQPGLRQQKAAVLLAEDESSAAQYRSLYRSGALTGDVRWLEHGELSHVEARISPEIPGGLYLGDTAEISPLAFTSALWAAAKSRGARLVTAEVESISADASGSVAVRAGGETYSTAGVIVATGPWSGRLLSSAGVNVPVEPLKGQIVRLRAPQPAMRVSLWWGPDYAGSKADGLLWCGTTEERVGFNEDTTQPAQDSILQSTRRVLPFLADAEVVTQTACLRPVTADGLPTIGSLASMPNVVLATGGGRNGIVLGPALGKVAADILVGDDPGIDYEYLGPGRFGA